VLFLSDLGLDLVEFRIQPRDAHGICRLETLLLDAQIRLALEVAAEVTHWPSGTRPAPSRMTHVKMRSFIPPGATLVIDAELAPRATEATLKLSARMDDKTVATARLEVVARKRENARAYQ